MDWKEITKKLDAPFPLDDIEFRIGSTTQDKKKGLLLAYVTNRATQQRLDDVFGKGRWRNSFERWSMEKGNICTIEVYDDGLQVWIGKQDGADDSNKEPFKGGLSDAMKRTAVQWGIGRYLYKLPFWWASIVPRGKSFVPADGEEDRVKSEFPKWTLPDGEKPPPKPKQAPKASTPKPASTPSSTDGVTDKQISRIWGILWGEVKGEGNQYVGLTQDGQESLIRRYCKQMIDKIPSNENRPTKEEYEKVIDKDNLKKMRPIYEKLIEEAKTGGDDIPF